MTETYIWESIKGARSSQVVSNDDENVYVSIYETLIMTL